MTRNKRSHHHHPHHHITTNTKNIRGYVQDCRSFHIFFNLGYTLCVIGLITFLVQVYYNKSYDDNHNHNHNNNNVILIGSSLFLLVLGCIILRTMYCNCRVPQNNIQEYLSLFGTDESTESDEKCAVAGKKKKAAPLLVCVGDSITHGTCSSNWVNQIVPTLKQRTRYDNNNTDSNNGGINNNDYPRIGTLQSEGTNGIVLSFFVCVYSHFLNVGVFFS